MIRCLNKEDLDKFLKSIIEKISDEEYEDYIAIFEGCQLWEEKVIIVNYLTTQIIQREIKRGTLSKEFLNEVYNLPNLGNIEIEEIDSNLIEFMFNHTRFSKDINLNLLHLKEKFESHDYSAQIRN